MATKSDQVYETLFTARPVHEIAIVTLNRPEKLNAMTFTMFHELLAVARELDQDDDLRTVIITGAGKGFCAGFDLDQVGEFAQMGIKEYLKFQETAADAMLAIKSMHVPVIAAVNGPATGGGLALALAADIRLASTAAKFNAAFVKIGLSCGELGTSWILPRLVGPSRAAELCFTGRLVEAEEAEHIGLVNAVFPQEGLLDGAMKMAQQISANSPAGIHLTKRSLQSSMETGSYAAAMESENRGQILLTRGRDFPEALTAFKEKRLPEFTGT